MNGKLVERAQTGVRIEKSLLKVLKGLAEYCIVMHSFEGKEPFSQETRRAIEELKKVYHCELSAADSHKLREDGA